MHVAGVAILLAVCTQASLLPAWRDPSFGIRVQQAAPGTPRTSLRIQDFASHFNFARSVWRGETTAARGGPSVYSLANHLQVTSRWAGAPGLPRALPFGYSPTLIWVLAPLTPLSIALGYVVFALLSVAAVAWLTRPTLGLWGLGVLVFLTPLGFDCLSLGQTALLSTAGLVFLARESASPPSRWQTALRVVVLWALTAKPPLALVAGTALLARGAWRQVAWAVGLTLASTLALSPWLGAGWVGDYLTLLTHYDRSSAPPELAWSLHPEQMANLRGVLFDLGLRDGLAVKLSSALWLAALAAVLVARRRLSRHAAWGLAVLAFLLLCPHVTLTELLALWTLVALAAPASRRRWLLAVLGVAGVASTTHLFGPLTALLFPSLLLLAAALVWPPRAGRRRGDPPPEPDPPPA